MGGGGQSRHLSCSRPQSADTGRPPRPHPQASEPTKAPASGASWGMRNECLSHGVACHPALLVHRQAAGRPLTHQVAPPALGHRGGGGGVPRLVQGHTGHGGEFESSPGLVPAAAGLADRRVSLSLPSGASASEGTRGARALWLTRRPVRSGIVRSPEREDRLPERESGRTLSVHWGLVAATSHPAHDTL